MQRLLGRRLDVLPTSKPRGIALASRSRGPVRRLPRPTEAVAGMRRRLHLEARAPRKIEWHGKLCGHPTPEFPLDLVPRPVAGAPHGVHLHRPQQQRSL